jgi:hypothetical protein
VLAARALEGDAPAIRFAARAAGIAIVALLAVNAIHVASAAAAPSFDGVVLDARLVNVDTTTASVIVRIDPIPGGSFARPPLDLLTKDVVLYTNTVSGSLAHSYRAGSFMDPFETTVPLGGDTSTYPFHHLMVEISALASTAGGVRSGTTVPLQLHILSNLAGYRVSSRSARVRQRQLVDVVLHVDPSWAAVLFAVFIMVVMWGLALAAVAVAVSLVARRRRFEAGFTGFLAVLLFAFPTVRNSLPGIPPVGVLFDYAAFFWAEALVALALIALITGWTVQVLVGTVQRRD